MSEGKLRVVEERFVKDGRNGLRKVRQSINQSINDDVWTRWSLDLEVAWHSGVNIGVRGYMREARGVRVVWWKLWVGE